MWHGKSGGRRVLLGTVAAAAICSGSAWAQDAQDVTEVDEIIVTGIRGSVEQSIDLKRDAERIIDVVTAEDIGRLPDQNIAETLQRVPGVQIARKDGEGSTFTIRGITLNRVEINGRTFTGPTQGGTPALETLNPEILSGLEVIKSVTADMVEGALGGTVNLLTKRPLDLDNFLVSGRLQGSYDSLAEELGYRTSALISGTTEDGSFGALAAFAFQDQTTRGESFVSEGWTRTNGIDGNGDGTADPGLFRPVRIVSVIEPREDERLTGNVAFQWRPTSELEFILEGTYSDFQRQRQVQRYQVILNDNDTGAVALSDGSVVAGTFSGVTLRPLVYDEPTSFETLSIGLSGTFERGPLTLSGDVSYSQGEGSEGQAQASPFTPIFVPRAGRTVSTTFDFRDRRYFPDYSLAGNFNIDDPNQYQLTAIFDGFTLNDNSGVDGRLDLDYDFDSGLFTRFEAGVRFEDVEIYSAAYQNLPTAPTLLARADTNGDGIITPNEIPSLTYDNRYSGGFFSGIGGSFPRTFPTGFVDKQAVRDGLNLGAAPLVPTTVNDVQETTQAAYAKVNFEGQWGAVPWRGNVGLRYVTTERTVNGFGSGGGVIVPVTFESDFDHWLPSGNISFDLTEDLVLRLAAASVVARPPLNDLGAGTTYQITNSTGFGGNPNLEPYAADQFEATLEWYFAPASLLSGAVFQKNVNSFTAPVVTQENIPGLEIYNPFRITRPANGEDGEVRGFEVNYQHALQFLPAPFDGLGYALSYTYADSETPIIDELTGQRLPLPNLSENSYSAVVYYENERVSARLAYTYRDAFLEVIQGAAVGGSRYNDAYDQLDASVTVNLNDDIKFVVEGSNLTESINTRYVGTPNRLFTTNLEGARLYFGVLATF